MIFDQRPISFKDMKISDIPSSPHASLNRRVTIVLSDEMLHSLGLIASSKKRTISEVAREILIGVLAENQDELKRLG